MKCRKCGRMFKCSPKEGEGACSSAGTNSYVCMCSVCDEGFTSQLCTTIPIVKDKKFIGGYKILQKVQK